MLKKLIYLSSFLLLVSCGTSEPATEADEDRAAEVPRTLLEIPDEIVEVFVAEQLSEDEKLMLDYRTSLSDQYSEEGLAIPEIFLREVTYEEREVDPYAGFRVQILSTRDVAEADSVRDNFVAWADSVIAGYEPEAYVLFRSPNFRVRTGDFQDRDRALEFSRLVRSKYPDAWVVHDRIEPESVPADTANIKFREAIIPVLNIEPE